MSSPSLNHEQIPHLLIFGLGVLGGMTLDLIARTSRSVRITVGVRDVEKGQIRARLSQLVASNLGYDQTIEVVGIDVADTDRVAELIASVRPDVVFNATTLQSWWIVPSLPADLKRQLEVACVGPWLPMHLSLSLSLMRAVRSSGIAPLVVNGSYPDAVNPTLAKIGLAPTVGIGNVANTIPVLRHSVAQLLQVPVETVAVRFVAHHFVSFRLPGSGDTGRAPFHLAVYSSQERTHVDPARIFGLLPTAFRRTRGLAGQGMTASSAHQILQAALFGSASVLHAPGPLGLEGGYPIRLSGRSLQLALPEDLSEESALDINRRGQWFDGIEAIGDDGTVAFSEPASAIMKEVLAYDHRTMKVAEASLHADELGRKFRSFCERHGVAYPITAN